MNEPWIKHPTLLKGTIVDLLPLKQEHFEELYLAASDRKIWEFMPVNGSDCEKLLSLYQDALTEREKGNHYPFVIFHKHRKKLIGSTRLFEIHPKDRKVEIGWTWLQQSYWGTAVNLECKLMLLTFCFEKLKTIRVQFRTSDKNIRSQKAIEKIGGKFEGIFRKDRIQDNGATRNSAYYSIIDEEWEKAKQNLKTLLDTAWKSQSVT